MLKRSLLGTDASAALLTAGLTTTAGAAQAAPVATGSSGRTMVLPAPPADAHLRAAAAASPSVSPYAPSTHQSTGVSFS
ncbi:hypothetical protein [Streptomyces sp.]|uniref:hypothetical protein n=1 Tax=Streptomyces sp. TaxID=1931 RepID=UPI002F93D82B